MRLDVSILCGVFFSQAVIGTSVVRNPSAPTKTYRVIEILGEGRWGIVHKVESNIGVVAAMKADKIAVSLSDCNVEAEALHALRNTGFAPNLIDSFVIRDSSSTGRRHSVMAFVGPSVKQLMQRSTRPLAEFTVGSIVLSLLDGLSKVHAAGYYHNDIHHDNIAFAIAENVRDILLLDFGNASPLHVSTPPSYVSEAFSAEAVLNTWVVPEYRDTDKSWFRWAIQHRDDSHIDGFLSGRSWSPEAKIAIRNARILTRMQSINRSSLNFTSSLVETFEKIVLVKDSSTDRDWFMWTLTGASDDSHVGSFLDSRSGFTSKQKNLILATRGLALFTAWDMGMRKEFARCAKATLQMFSVGPADDAEFSWFFELMDGPRSNIAAYINGHGVNRPEAVAMTEAAWDVMHGATPDYDQYRFLALRMVEKHGRSFTGRILW